jgi:hypothetical protein
VSEQFNKVEALRETDGTLICEIETTHQNSLGKLWLSPSWLTVSDARRVRDWLDRVIPPRIPGSGGGFREPAPTLTQPLDPRRGEPAIVDNE